MRLSPGVRLGAVPVKQVHSAPGKNFRRCTNCLKCFCGVYMPGKVEAKNDTGWIALHAVFRKLTQEARPQTARVSKQTNQEERQRK